MRSTPDIPNPDSKQPNPGSKQPDLSTEQSAWLLGAVGPVEVVRDLSWDTTTSRVWHLRDSDGTNLILKVAGPPMEKHIEREIRAHETAARELSGTGDAQQLVAADSRLGVLVLTYLRGNLVEGTDFEFDPEVHFQAGQLLGRLHRRGSQVAPSQAAPARGDDDNYERNLVARTRWWLDGKHNIPASQVEQINSILDTCTPGPIRLVPTHGDWHPRNWLVDDSGATPHVMAIDFGRFDWRSPQSDLLRLQLMQWNGRPDLEAAFLRGYGEDPRTNSWKLELIYQAVANACWAHMMGDVAFEQQGLREITMVLETEPK